MHWIKLPCGTLMNLEFYGLVYPPEYGDGQDRAVAAKGIHGELVLRKPNHVDLYEQITDMIAHRDASERKAGAP